MTTLFELFQGIILRIFPGDVPVPIIVIQVGMYYLANTSKIYGYDKGIGLLLVVINIFLYYLTLY